MHFRAAPFPIVTERRDKFATSLCARLSLKISSRLFRFPAGLVWQRSDATDANTDEARTHKTVNGFQRDVSLMGHT